MTLATRVFGDKLSALREFIELSKQFVGLPKVWHHSRDQAYAERRLLFSCRPPSVFDRPLPCTKGFSPSGFSQPKKTFAVHRSRFAVLCELCRISGLSLLPRFPHDARTQLFRCGER
jgi:hypothetical protein